LGAKALGEAAVYFLDMVQISISPATFAAIAETMPIGSIGFENARAPNGDRFIWLPRDVLEKLNQWRAPGEGIVKANEYRPFSGSKLACAVTIHEQKQWSSTVPGAQTASIEFSLTAQA
jgi:hypothetical protein